MAMVAPMLIILLFGSVELGHYFLAEHSLANQTRNAARYAARLPLVENYSCESSTPITATAEADIIDVATTGKVNPTTTDPKRLPFGDTDTGCSEGAAPLDVTVRCVPQEDYPGLWRGYDGDIPVVQVTGAIRYRPLFGPIGFASDALCLRAKHEMPVIGL